MTTSYLKRRHSAGTTHESSCLGAHPWALARLLFDQNTGKQASQGVEELKAVTKKLAQAVRAERRRGRAGHWSYDLNRHIALAQALKAETHHLRQLESNERARKGARSSDVPE